MGQTDTMKHYLSLFLFGRTKFLESEEYFEFRYKFLCVLMLMNVASVLMFLALHTMELIYLAPSHITLLGFSAIAVTMLWRILLHQKKWFWLVAFIFEIIILAKIISAAILIPQDELRILWFYINIAGVYIIGGQKLGLILTLFTGLGLIISNPFLSVAYSFHALITAEVCLVYWSLFFHVHANRSLSYFRKIHEYNNQLYHQATHDPLTNVLNARAYYEICEKLLKKYAFTPYHAGVLFIDLDHFKMINDTHGHQTGDEVLQSVAECMRKNLRATDVLGRIGGEEFSVFLPTTTHENAVAIAEKLREAVAQLRPPMNHENIHSTSSLQVTASIGVAITQGHWNESMTLIQRRADAAMYVAKKEGRNRVNTVV